MRNLTLLKGLLPTLILFSTQAGALPFQTLDTRSLGMGGVGVASGNSGSAGLKNPALLSLAPEDEDFHLVISAGARYLDPEDLIDAAENFETNNYIDNFSDAIDAFNAAPGPGTEADNVVSTGTDLLAGFRSISNKTLYAEGFGGVVMAFPGKKLGVSVHFAGRALGDGKANISETDLNNIQSILTDLDNGNYGAITNPTTSLNSDLRGRGALIGEVGIALSHEFKSLGGVAMGITPKYMKLQTYDYEFVGDALDNLEIDAEIGEIDYNDFNIDFGLAKDFGNGWRTGLVAKNLISEDYLTANNNVVKIEPQLRVGVAKSGENWTLATDIDLIENEPAGFESKSQFIGVGGEISFFGWLDLRAGYQHNMSDSNDSMPTLGLGISPGWFHADISVAGNDDQLAISGQLGIQF